MRQAGLLVASFIVTLTVLSGLFFVAQGMSPPAPTPAPTATPTATAAPTAASTPGLTARPTPRPTPAQVSSAPTSATTPRPTVAPTAEPTASTGATLPAPTVPVPPSAGPAGRILVVVRGDQYSHADVASHGTLTPSTDGSITITSDRMYGDQTEVDWELPEGSIPAGATIRSLDVKVCGTGSGDFWESYGPEGSDPIEEEVTAPQADGCWHYNGAPGPDTLVKVFIRLASTMTISRIEYSATVSR